MRPLNTNKTLHHHPPSIIYNKCFPSPTHLFFTDPSQLKPKAKPKPNPTNPTKSTNLQPGKTWSVPSCLGSLGDDLVGDQRQVAVLQVLDEPLHQSALRLFRAPTAMAFLEVVHKTPYYIEPMQQKQVQSYYIYIYRFKGRSLSVEAFDQPSIRCFQAIYSFRGGCLVQLSWAAEHPNLCLETSSKLLSWKNGTIQMTRRPLLRSNVKPDIFWTGISFVFGSLPVKLLVDLKKLKKASTKPSDWISCNFFTILNKLGAGSSITAFSHGLDGNFTTKRFRSWQSHIEIFIWYSGLLWCLEGYFGTIGNCMSAARVPHHDHSHPFLCIYPNGAQMKKRKKSGYHLSIHWFLSSWLWVKTLLPPANTQKSPFQDALGLYSQKGTVGFDP